VNRRQSWCFFFPLFDGEISHRGDRKKKSSAKVTKDFFGKRTPKSPYFEEKKSLKFATFLNKYILRRMFLRKIKSKAAIFWGGEKV
jgi:hypothetical protein